MKWSSCCTPQLKCSAHRACSIHDREAKYYADGEDAYDMRKKLRPAKAKGDDGKALARKAKA